MPLLCAGLCRWFVRLFCLQTAQQLSLIHILIDETRHYQPDPLLAPYVEQTFQKYADGATMTDLRDWLKAHNIKNSMGGEMSYNTIQRMLSNRRYIGELRLRDVVQPNAIPALVSGELVGARPLHLATQDRSVA